MVRKFGFHVRKKKTPVDPRPQFRALIGVLNHLHFFAHLTNFIQSIFFKKASELEVGDTIDLKDLVGRFLPSVVVEKKSSMYLKGSSKTPHRKE